MPPDRDISLPFGREADPRAVQRASAATWDAWVDSGRAAELEAPGETTDDRFWADVRAELARDGEAPPPLASTAPALRQQATFELVRALRAQEDMAFRLLRAVQWGAFVIVVVGAVMAFVAPWSLAALGPTIALAIWKWRGLFRRAPREFARPEGQRSG